MATATSRTRKVLGWSASLTRPRARIVHGEDFPASQIEAAYRLRVGVLPNRPGLSETEARSDFERRLACSNLCCLIESRSDLLGVVAMNVAVHTWEGRDLWLVVGRFAALRPEIRGNRQYVRALASGLVRRTIRRPRLPRFAYGEAYPSSLLTAMALFDDMRLYDGPNAPDWEGRLLHHLATTTEAGTLDPTRLAVRLRTVPAERDHRPRDPKRRELLRRYEQRNPHWREGYAIPVLLDLDAWALTTGVTRSLRQMLRDRRTSSPPV